jgi:glycosyltransferase involved in cell wall biosynthesis
MVCQEVVNRLVSRGSTVTVLTKTKTGLPSSRSTDLSILRKLFLTFPESHPNRATFKLHLRHVWRDVWNRFLVARFSRSWKPDIVLVFNPSGLGAPLLEWLHSSRCKGPVVHDISDEWLLFAYQQDAWFCLAKRDVWFLVKRVIRDSIIWFGRFFLPRKPRALALRQSYFTSHYLKQKFLAGGEAEAASAPVIHRGIRFNSTKENGIRKPGSILYASRLCPEKGLHVLLRALSLPLTASEVELTVAGKGTDDEYRKELERLIAELPANCRVNMVGHVSHPEVQVLLRNHAIFAFPVTWNEPFSLVLLEAMHAGIAIVSTATGGSKEVLRHDENALVVERNDADDLAAGLNRLLTNEQSRRRLGTNAQASVLPFDLDKMLDRIEQHLQSVLNNSQSA